MVKEYKATDDARQNHRGKEGSIFDSINPQKSFMEHVESLFVNLGGYIAGSMVSLGSFNYYYSYYTPQCFLEYIWVTHETDSFLYYLHQGNR